MDPPSCYCVERCRPPLDDDSWASPASHSASRNLSRSLTTASTLVCTSFAVREAVAACGARALREKGMAVYRRLSAITLLATAEGFFLTEEQLGWAGQPGRGSPGFIGLAIWNIRAQLRAIRSVPEPCQQYAAILAHGRNADERRNCIVSCLLKAR